VIVRPRGRKRRRQGPEADDGKEEAAPQQQRRRRRRQQQPGVRVWVGYGWSGAPLASRALGPCWGRS
jgi:hypothetical protein